MPDTTAEWRSDSVAAVTRAANVEAYAELLEDGTIAIRDRGEVDPTAAEDFLGAPEGEADRTYTLLTGLVDPDSPAATSAVTDADGGWRLVLDPRAFAVGRPEMPALLAARQAPIVLAAGEHDPMSPAEHLHDLVPDPVILPGVGHNAQVEQPAALVPILERLRPDPSN